MRTLIVSDLHLGGGERIDLLRRPELRAPLLEALEGADRLVLLGDVLELRGGLRRDAMAVARPFFEDLGRSFAGREVVLVPGNHDYALIAPWLARRGELRAPAPLSLEQRPSPAEASPAAATLAKWAAPAKLVMAYPGLWLRPDVYATHGHYLDCHLTVPSLERLSIGAMMRMLRRPASAFAGPDDYEAAQGPLFAWIDAVAQQAATGSAVSGQATVRVWRALQGRQGRRSLRSRALAGAFPVGIAALNRAGLGPLSPDISGPELRRAGLRAMGDVAQRLGLGAHVIFGHTHRAGPLPHDDHQEWGTPSGARLMNSGCWTFDSWFIGAAPAEDPYWPGGYVTVEEEGPPVLRRLLDDRSRAQIEPPAAATPSPA